MKYTFVHVAVLFSLATVHAHPQDRVMTCGPEAACPEGPCNDQGATYICEFNECICKAPDEPPSDELVPCVEQKDCEGKRACPQQGTVPFCDNGFCRSCQVPPPMPYHVLRLAEVTVPWGTSVNEEEGHGMMQILRDALMSHCPEGQAKCDTAPIDLGRISLILNEGREYMFLQATIDRSQYKSKESRDLMIAAISLGTVGAARSSCTKVSYKEPVQGGFGCPDPDHTGLSYRRDSHSSLSFKEPSREARHEPRQEQRIGDGDVDLPERTCNFVTNMCAGPKTLYAINGVHGDAENFDDMLLRFELVAPPDQLGDTAAFVCTAAAGALAGTLMSGLPTAAAEILGIVGIPDDPIELMCGEYVGPEPEDFEPEP